MGGCPPMPDHPHELSAWITDQRKGLFALQRTPFVRIDLDPGVIRQGQTLTEVRSGVLEDYEDELRYRQAFPLAMTTEQSNARLRILGIRSQSLVCIARP